MLADAYGRRITYLRLSVTDRCNYRCFYCRPAGGDPGRAARAELLSLAETVRLVRLFTELGVTHVRITGGEPLVRRDLPELARAIAAMPGVSDLSLSTNGQLLACHAATLREAGVRRVNISLDALDPAIFSRITGGGDVRAVLRGIDAARAAGLSPLRLNMVVLRGVNESEIERMVEFASGIGAEARFIETMPIGPSGLHSMAYYFPAAEILERVRRVCGARLHPILARTGAGPAHYFELSPGGVRIGVISAVSQHFCATCNRGRLTAAGELGLCLGAAHRVDLRKILRQGLSDNDLKTQMQLALLRKPHSHEFAHAGAVPITLPMSALGG